MGPAEIAEAFFAANPCQLADLPARVDSFVSKAAAAGRRVVCVTSGGTTVPLERNCVRFIDNFSRGTRGALSTEEFLKNGYAVVFITRRGTIQPFSEGLPTEELVDCMARDPAAAEAETGGIPLVSAFAEAARALRRVEGDGSLLRIPFTSLFEYLLYLRVVATTMDRMGSAASFYLAAAVSDFYMPMADMAEHKIQSSHGPLVLTLPKVPKMLAALRSCWAPRALVVSFKLETDERILLQKARGAIGNYAVHAVVANLLHTRKERVWIVRNAATIAPPDSGLTGTPALTRLAKGHTSPTDPCIWDGGESPNDGFSRGLAAVRSAEGLGGGVRDAVQGGTNARLVATAGSTDCGSVGDGGCDGSDASVQVLDRPAAEPYIETQIVAEIIALHDMFLSRPPSGPL